MRFHKKKVVFVLCGLFLMSGISFSEEGESIESSSPPKVLNEKMMKKKKNMKMEKGGPMSFQSMDSNSDGFVDSEEYIKAHESWLQNKFNRIDKNDDERIDLKELRRFRARAKKQKLGN